MSITVHYFASLKEHLGRPSDTLDYSNNMTVQEAWQQANPELPMPRSILAAVNMEYVSLNSLINDGDTVAFFPPVTGG